MSDAPFRQRMPEYKKSRPHGSKNEICFWEWYQQVNCCLGPGKQKAYSWWAGDNKRHALRMELCAIGELPSGFGGSTNSHFPCSSFLKGCDVRFQPSENINQDEIWTSTRKWPDPGRQRWTCRSELTELSPEVELLRARTPLEAAHASVRRPVRPVLPVAAAELVHASRLRAVDGRPQLLELSISATTSNRKCK